MINNKRGVSHVEIIISVVLFLGFVGLALFFFSPGDTDRLVDTTLIYAFDEVISNTSIDVESYSVILDCSGGCNGAGIKIPGIDDNLEVSAIDENGVNLLSRREGDWVYVQNGGKDFFTIKYGEDFEENSGVGQVSDSVYTLGASDSKKIISKKMMLALTESYDADYRSLKKDGFNLPDRIDFEFELTGLGNPIKPNEIEKISGAEVFGKTERVEVIDEFGKTSFGELTISVW